MQDAGLVVDSCWRWHFGTTYYIVASAPTSEAATAAAAGAAKQQGLGVEAAHAA